tara:strand:+ start:473 stop:694 length:222 start_codon:yes stop_codon:yes gene_type:complete
MPLKELILMGNMLNSDYIRVRVALGRELGRNRKTARDLLIKLNVAYLLRDLHPKQTGGKYKMIPVEKTKRLKS